MKLSMAATAHMDKPQAERYQWIDRAWNHRSVAI